MGGLGSRRGLHLPRKLAEWHSVQTLFAAVVRRVDEYRHWSARAGPDQAQQPIGPNSTHRALQISRAARVSHKHRNCEVRDECAGAQQAKPSSASKRDDRRTPQMLT